MTTPCYKNAPPRNTSRRTGTSRILQPTRVFLWDEFGISGRILLPFALHKSLETVVDIFWLPGTIDPSAGSVEEVGNMALFRIMGVGKRRVVLQESEHNIHLAIVRPLGSS